MNLGLLLLLLIQQSQCSDGTVYSVVAVVALGFTCPSTLYVVAICYAPIVISAVGVESAAASSASVATLVASDARFARSRALVIDYLRMFSVRASPTTSCLI
jgi:hypothetical protein